MEKKYLNGICRIFARSCFNHCKQSDMCNKPISDKTIEDLRQGNHKAFELVFVTYFNKIKCFINSYIKSEDDAEELAEELFVNLWYNRLSIDPSRSFHSFIHTIARNSSINYLKHQTVHASYLNNTSAADHKSYSSEDDLIAQETALLIEMAIEKMPNQRKQIYQLSRKEGLSNEEIAARLNLSKSNVESHLSLALKDIRKAILSFLLFVP